MIYLELFYVFFTIGLFTFGGGHAMIPLLQQEVVSHGWASEKTVIDFIAVSESTPGPFAVNMATFIGNKMGGAFGTFCAVLGIVLPSFIIILIIARFFGNFRENKYVKSVFSILRPVTLGLIAYAALRIVISAIVDYTKAVPTVDFWAIGITLAVFALSYFYKKIHPILLICISAIMGVIIYGVIL